MSQLDSTSLKYREHRSIRNFFCAAEVPYGLALVRITLPLTILIPMAYRWPFSRELFSSDGAIVSMGCMVGRPAMIPALPGGVAVCLHSVLLFALVASSIGWCTRISLVVATAGYVYLNLLDILGTLNKSSAIAAHLMVLLCCSQCGAIWSVDSWLKRSRRGRGPQAFAPDASRDRVPVLPRRLMQILMGIVYLSAAMTKLQTRAYFSGEHLQTWMLTSYHSPNLLGHLFALHPSVVIVFANVTFLWELLFIFLAWRGTGRIVMLGLGAVFHLMTCLTLGLFIFPMICVSSYCAFFGEPDAVFVASACSRWRGRGTGFRAAIGRLLRPRTLPALSPIWSRPAASHAIFACLALATAIAGAGLEHKLDLYGIRRPQGPYELKQIDPARVDKLLAPNRRIEHEDMVFNFDVGSIMVGGAVLDRRTQFCQGERLRAQCGFLPPHEAMWVECNLHDAENRAVEARGAFVAFGSLRTLFDYKIDDAVAPGKYSLVLKIAGAEIMRRSISILPRRQWARANPAAN